MFQRPFFFNGCYGGSDEGGKKHDTVSSISLRARLPLAVLAAAAPAMAQDYPTRPVTIVVGYTPGATSDLLARTMAERLNAAWGSRSSSTTAPASAAISEPASSRGRRPTAIR